MRIAPLALTLGALLVACEAEPETVSGSDLSARDAAQSLDTTPPRDTALPLDTAPGPDAQAHQDARPPRDVEPTDTLVVPPEPDAAFPAEPLPLGDCDRATELTCSLPAVCAAASLPELSVCVAPLPVYEKPGCGPEPHPDGVGTITPTCCTSAACVDDRRVGRCIYSENVTGCCGTQGRTDCAYDACASDADCGFGSVCLPAGARGLAASTCVPAQCRSDAHCAEDANCRLVGQGAFSALVCLGPDAECRTDADCQGDCPGAFCATQWVVEQGVWQLVGGSSCDITACQAVP